MTASILAFSPCLTVAMRVLQQKERRVNVATEGAETKKSAVSTKMLDHSSRASAGAYVRVGQVSEHMSCSGGI